jgi:hypothetical protein
VAAGADAGGGGQAGVGPQWTGDHRLHNHHKNILIIITLITSIITTNIIQVVSITLGLTETVASIKNKIMEELAMPQGKQKLQHENIFFKVSCRMINRKLS